MLSDGISVNGYRRKPWLVVGWVGFTIVNLVLVYLQSPGINTTIFLVVGFTFFLVLSDGEWGSYCVRAIHWSLSFLSPVSCLQCVLTPCVLSARDMKTTTPGVAYNPRGSSSDHSVALSALSWVPFSTTTANHGALTLLKYSYLTPLFRCSVCSSSSGLWWRSHPNSPSQSSLSRLLMCGVCCSSGRCGNPWYLYSCTMHFRWWHCSMLPPHPTPKRIILCFVLTFLSLHSPMGERMSLFVVDKLHMLMLIVGFGFVSQVPNSAFDNFLVWGLGFSDEQLGYLTITTSIIGCAVRCATMRAIACWPIWRCTCCKMKFSWQGYIVFKVFLFETSWRFAASPFPSSSSFPTIPSIAKLLPTATTAAIAAIAATATAYYCYDYWQFCYFDDDNRNIYIGTSLVSAFTSLMQARYGFH